MQFSKLTMLDAATNRCRHIIPAPPPIVSYFEKPVVRYYRKHRRTTAHPSKSFQFYCTNRMVLRSDVDQDYYEVLKVHKDVKKAELKTAYLGLCKELHPDVNKSAGAEQRFKLVQEAYRVLSHDAARANYDMSREAFEVGNYRYARGNGAVYAPRAPRKGLHKLVGIDAFMARGGWFLLMAVPFVGLGLLGLSSLRSDVKKYDEPEPKMVRGKQLRMDIRICYIVYYSG